MDLLSNLNNNKKMDGALKENAVTSWADSATLKF